MYGMLIMLMITTEAQNKMIVLNLDFVFPTFSCYSPTY